MTDSVAMHVVIMGRVQGVGFRHWTARGAGRFGLGGWVRNRSDGSVEAVFVGPAAVVDDMIAKCRLGPRSSEVSDVIVTPADARHAAAGEFVVLPTA